MPQSKDLKIIKDSIRCSRPRCSNCNEPLVERTIINGKYQEYTCNCNQLNEREQNETSIDNNRIQGRIFRIC